MENRAIFSGKLLAFLLVAPQLAISLIFFYWPAAQALWQSFLVQDAFGLSTEFVWFENYVELLKTPEYYQAIGVTFVFSALVAFFSLTIGLLLAVAGSVALNASYLIQHAGSVPAPTIAESDVGNSPDAEAVIQRLTRFTRPINYLGLPSLSIPSGLTKTGLPVGMQLVGRSFDEAMLLRIGAAFQRATDFHERVPQLP